MKKVENPYIKGPDGVWRVNREDEKEEEIMAGEIKEKLAKEQDEYIKTGKVEKIKYYDDFKKTIEKSKKTQIEELENPQRIQKEKEKLDDAFELEKQAMPIDQEENFESNDEGSSIESKIRTAKDFGELNDVLWAIENPPSIKKSIRKWFFGKYTFGGNLYDAPHYKGVNVDELSILIRKTREEARMHPTTYTSEGGGPKYLNSFPDGSLREKIKELLDKELGNTEE